MLTLAYSLGVFPHYVPAFCTLTIHSSSPLPPHLSHPSIPLCTSSSLSPSPLSFHFSMYLFLALTLLPSIPPSIHPPTCTLPVDEAVDSGETDGSVCSTVHGGPHTRSSHCNGFLLWAVYTCYQVLWLQSTYALTQHCSPVTLVRELGVLFTWI